MDFNEVKYFGQVQGDTGQSKENRNRKNAVNEIGRSAGQEIGTIGDHGNVAPMKSVEILGRALDFPQDVGKRLCQLCLNPPGPGDPC